jgi:hypothetical protein
VPKKNAITIPTIVVKLDTRVCVIAGKLPGIVLNNATIPTNTIYSMTIDNAMLASYTFCIRYPRYSTVFAHDDRSRKNKQCGANNSNGHRRVVLNVIVERDASRDKQNNKNANYQHYF